MGQEETRHDDARTTEVIRREDGALVMREAIQGPEVLLAFGSKEHSHEVCLPPTSLPVLAGRMSVESGELASALEEWLEEGYLIELMDMLDVAEIDYTYAVNISGTAVVRPAGSESW